MKNESTSSLAIMTKVERMLGQANTVQEAKEVKDLALTAADFARRKGLGEQAIKKAKSYAVRAEIKMGELLKATERAKRPAGPGRGKVGAAALPTFTGEPTLAEIGLTKRESAEAQALASVSKPLQVAVIVGNKTKRQALRESKKETTIKKAAKLPSGRYRVVYADPPWSYGNTMPDYFTEQADHYPLMTLKEICELPVKDMVYDNAVLFLWVTSPILEESFSVIKAWGFKYKASFVWDKIKHNMGHYNSVRHEFLLVCVRGSCQPDEAKLFDSVQSIERPPKHSEKPEQFRRIIDTLYPNGPRIELFARKQHKGWKQHGNELAVS